MHRRDAGLWRPGRIAVALEHDSQSLIPVNATVLERALERVTRRVDRIPVPLRDLKRPDVCPAQFLPWLAYEESIDSWSPDWPEDVKRNLIAKAIEIQRMKGTAASVREVVEAFGGSIALREWWQQDPPGEPFTFDLVLTLNGEGGQPATATFVNQVIDEVARTKPVRAHFNFTQGVTAQTGVGIAAAARPAVFRRLQLEAA